MTKPDRLNPVCASTEFSLQGHPADMPPLCLHMTCDSVTSSIRTQVYLNLCLSQPLTLPQPLGLAFARLPLVVTDVR